MKYAVPAVMTVALLIVVRALDHQRFWQSALMGVIVGATFELGRYLRRQS